ncbi:hypothetical protein [Brevibacterium linens]|nr:hypothetical protein [Brevibacterium linens]
MEALSILGFTGAATLIAGVIFIIGGYSRLSKGRQLAKLGALPEQIDTPAEAADPADATDRSDAAASGAPGAADADDSEDPDDPDNDTPVKKEP